MTCPYLDYRDEGSGRTFDEARAYCTAAERFVQAMRADICNDRYDLDHEHHCEIYRAHAGGDDSGQPDGGDNDLDDEDDCDPDEAGAVTDPADGPSKSGGTDSTAEGSE